MNYKNGWNIILISFLILIIPKSLFAQNIKGQVFGIDNGKSIPLSFVNLIWAGTNSGAISDESGNFSIVRNSENNSRLVVSYIGYSTDTITVTNNNFLTIRLKPDGKIEEVVIREHQPGEVISKMKTIQTQTITASGLRKMACCNLSESFQNSATVDVGYSDAVSGAKQIKMLGLAGIYSQLMIEKRPSFSGLSAPFGLMYIPGTWMESIQISKGTSSVTDGYESITGQINVELKKPQTSEPFFVNLYMNNEEKGELNLHWAKKLSNTWSTMVLSHISVLENEIDMNHDHFLDQPKTRQLNLSNRWKYENATNREAIFGFQYVDEIRNGGETAFNMNESHVGQSRYGTEIENRKIEIFGKHGYMFNNEKERSIGIILNLNYHSQNAFFGHREWNARQSSFFLNTIFTSLIFKHDCENESHEHEESAENKITAGISFKADDLIQELDSRNYNINEITSGIYSELSLNPFQKWSLIFGLRADHQTEAGIFITPRLHIKFDPFENTVLRFSAGKGFRSARVIAENLSFLASSRNLEIKEKLKLEEAVNYGFNLTQTLNIDEKRKIIASFDFYRTQFINQAVVNLDRASNLVVFSNLHGKSYSNSFQSEIKIDPIKSMEITLAFRVNDVKTSFDETLLEKPFVNKYKGLVALSWSSRFEKWKIDISGQYNGISRIPDLSENSNADHFPEYSPSYYLINFQLTRKFKSFDVYLGIENLGNYYQEHSIISSSEPFGPNFDASMIWGPISGRMFFAGFRYSL
jgi:outer membrane receptor for ferrienterochelin and colicins